MLRQPRVLCECEGVGRVTWGGREDTGRTASLDRGHISGRAPPRRAQEQEGGAARKAKLLRDQWEEQGGEGESEPEGEHICEVVGRGESWPGGL